MKEIRCPQCGCAISVDEADFAAIINQVRTEEFDAEVERRLEEENRVRQAEEARKAAEAAAVHARELSEKDSQITLLREQIKGWEEKKDLELEKLRLEQERKVS